MREIIIGAISSIVGALIMYLFSKAFFGYKHFGGIKKTIRLTKDAHNSGIINIFPNRKAYIQHKDHGKSYEYISKANHSVMYIGYWLATGTEIGELSDTIKELVHKQISVTLVFISPNDDNILNTCSHYISFDSPQISSRVKVAIKNLLDLKKSLGDDCQKYFEIKIHKIPLSSSALILDHSNPEECRILVDYKIFKGSREGSYGIEYKNSKKIITQKIMQSYLQIAKSAITINEFSDINRV